MVRVKDQQRQRAYRPKARTGCATCKGSPPASDLTVSPLMHISQRDT